MFHKMARGVIISFRLVRLLVLNVVVCLTLWHGQAVAQDVQQPGSAIAVDDSAEKDAAIAIRIRDILGELEGFDDVTVTVTSGIVTLRGTTVDQATGQRLTALVGRVEGVVAIENEVVETTDVVERLNPVMERFRTRMVQLVAFIPLALVALTAFFVVVALGALIARSRWPWDKVAPNAFIADIYRQILRLGFLVAGLVIALDILGATALLSTILGAAGIVGLAIGFAVRDTVENFIASIMLSIRQPFRPNDTVEINGDIGNVTRLTSRATVLLSFDGNHIRIPNSIVFKSRIVNFSRNDTRRFMLELGVSYGCDLAEAQAIALKTVTALPFVLPEPAPQAWIEGFGESAVDLRVTAWVAQHETSFVQGRGEAYRSVLAAFDAAGIYMPENTLRILQGPPEIDTIQNKTSADPPQEVSAIAETQLEQIVVQERATPGQEDLLNPTAPEE
jgi:small-conductance mechanosensitive channel